jgi:hypothetical protein
MKECVSNLSVFVREPITIFINKEIDKAHSQDACLKTIEPFCVIYAQNDEVKVEPFVVEIIIDEKIVVVRRIKDFRVSH